MPIKPENRKLYPAGPVWRKIRSEILSRANHRCECAGECGLNHGLRCEAFDRALGYWVDGDWHLTIEGEDVDASLVVLTIAHLDHDPTNNVDSNLRALCQRCHLRYDLDIHKHCSVCGRLEDLPSDLDEESAANIAWCPLSGGRECRAVAIAVDPWRRENDTLRAIVARLAANRTAT